MVFGRNVSQRCTFKKDSQLKLKLFYLPSDIVVVLVLNLLSFIRWQCHTEFFDIMILNCHYSQRKNSIPPFPYTEKNVQSFLFWGIWKSSLYTLNDDCISQKSRNLYQVRQAHVKICEMRQFRISLKNVCKLYL